MNNHLFGSAALVGMLALAVPAFAQSNPSSDQIINALKPTTSMLHSSVTRGIRPIAPSAGSDVVTASTASPAPAAAAPKAAKPTATRVAAKTTEPAPEPAEAPSVNLYVPFENGSAELTPQAIAALDELGKALSSAALSGYKFKIEGHTDTVGTKPYNLSLSDRRAAAVSAYLEQKFGVSHDRLETVGVGEAHLLVPTPDQTPEPRNRRVTVINLGA
jgi:outer membrane protein OmpA-like peptidoglycan-associated protein